jgi:hypothetical protein
LTLLTRGDSVTLASCPWVAFQTSWNSQHLFVAATTFATMFLDDSNDKQMWPAADLDWFSSQVFEVSRASRGAELVLTASHRQSRRSVCCRRATSRHASAISCSSACARRETFCASVS